MNSSELIERICDLTPEAVQHVSAALLRKHPNLPAAIGPRGVKACRADLAYHLDYLAGSLASGSSAPFVDYAVWLATLLRERHVRDDVLPESFSLLAEFFVSRLPGEAARPIRQILDDAVAALRGGTVVPMYNHALPEVWEDDARAYLGSLLAGDRKLAALGIAGRQGGGASLVQVETHIIQPAMYEIGNLWQANRISVAQEHLASAVTQAVMAEAFAAAEFAAPRGRRALMANIDQNFHVLGLRMVADAFEVGGWDVDFLGANVPGTSLLSQIDVTQPDLLGISVSLPSQLPDLGRLVEMLNAEFGQRRPAILVGGLAINALLGVGERLGADLTATDAEAALAVAESFTPQAEK